MDSTKDTDAKRESDDPYAYLERTGFTSEKFKIEIRNLPRYYGLKELKKLLNTKLDLKANKVKAPVHRSSWVYACFRSEEDRTHAIKILSGYKWKASVLKAEVAKAVPDPLVKKRIEIAESLQEGSSNNGNQLDKIKDVTTPLWNVPYEDQLSRKTRAMTTLLGRYAKELVQANPSLTGWVAAQQEKYNGLLCELLPIRHSKTSPNGYRNKCEFSIGTNDATGEKTIGFRLGSYVNGSISVAPLEDIPNVPERMKQASSIFQNHIRKSRHDVFNPETHRGTWQQMTCRYGFRTDELMLVVGIQPRDLSHSELSALEKDLVKFFEEGEGKSCNVTSLFLQLIEKRKSQDDKPVCKHLMGATYIHEKVLDRTFRISPQAFFQVNTNATDVLYETVAELAGLTKDVTLLDVCCGTGTIGICLSDKCGEVLGLEISSEAVADAKENALANNVQNAEFFEGKAEDILSAVAYKATKPEVVAIVDPPRAGLRQDALTKIRRTERINKLVYVSCDPRHAVKNFVDLGRATSKMYQREHFLPVKAVPVDLFPFTPHCELVIYLERQIQEADSVPKDQNNQKQAEEVQS